MGKIYKTINIILILLILFVIVLVGDNINESISIDKSIKEFKERSTLVYEKDNYFYYKVHKKYDFEDCNNICEAYTDDIIGTTGDIYISNRDPLGGFFITEWFSKIAWIGHAGIVYNTEGTQMVEVVGNKKKEDNVVKVCENNWLSKDSPEYIVIRVKNISDTDKNNIKKECDKVIGCKYNYMYLFSNDKSFYCTDLISYVYKKINVNLNKDALFTTGSDMITNANTYIIYYKEKVIKNNNICYNIYYLSEE